MDMTESIMTRQLAEAARIFQLQQTGRAPSNVSVIIGEDTLVLTLYKALSPAEQALARSPEGGTQSARVLPYVVSKFRSFTAKRN